MSATATVVVHFADPTEGIDPDDGETFVATRHRVVASALHPGDGETLFVDDGGAVLARWPTDAIERITWLHGAAPRRRSREWIAAQREAHSRAFERWDEEEVEQLKAEYLAKKTVPEMAEIHGRAAGGVMARLVSLQLIDRDTPMEMIGAETPLR
jgi:hypothetical protein